MMLAGATAVSMGTANFYNPTATEEAVKGIEEYMKRHQVEDIQTLIGAVR
jgi:dihydroorotate dehydrogenase (NAD+) catalytic subunit